MQVSVIMLTYNRQLFVGRAIESILSQSFSDYEFIIVNNGSTDQSGIICDDYGKKHNHIKVIHKEKGNIGSGRNVGLNVAKGKYITFVDDDDTAMPDMIEFLHSLIIKNNADISLCGSLREVNGKVENNFVFDDLLVLDGAEAVVEMLKRRKYNVAMPTKLFRRELVAGSPFPEFGDYDDITTGYKYFAEAKKVVGHGLPKYCFWRHPGNNSAFTSNDILLTPTQLDQYFNAFKERTIYLSLKHPHIAEFVQYTEWSYMISMVSKISKNNLINCQAQLNFAKKVLKENYDEFYNSPYIQPFEKDYMDTYIGGNCDGKSCFLYSSL